MAFDESHNSSHRLTNRAGLIEQIVLEPVYDPRVSVLLVDHTAEMMVLPHARHSSQTITCGSVNLSMVSPPLVVWQSSANRKTPLDGRNPLMRLGLRSCTRWNCRVSRRKNYTVMRIVREEVRTTLVT
jgi:hypothetical protein